MSINYKNNERVEYLKSIWNVRYFSTIHEEIQKRDISSSCEMNILINDDKIYNALIKEYVREHVEYSDKIPFLIC